MDIHPSAVSPDVKTRLHCGQTSGYNVKAGARYYEWCPFCGHRTDDQDHEVVIEADA